MDVPNKKHSVLGCLRKLCYYRKNNPGDVIIYKKRWKKRKEQTI